MKTGCYIQEWGHVVEEEKKTKKKTRACLMTTAKNESRFKGGAIYNI